MNKFVHVSIDHHQMSLAGAGCLEGDGIGTKISCPVGGGGTLKDEERTIGTPPYDISHDVIRHMGLTLLPLLKHARCRELEFYHDVDAVSL